MMPITHDQVCQYKDCEEKAIAMESRFLYCSCEKHLRKPATDFNHEKGGKKC